MAEYRLGPRAAADLEAIFDYTVAAWGLAQAVRYVEQVEAAFTELASAPTRSQACDDIRRGYRRRSVQRHVIYFTVEDYGVAIVRILHGQMDVERHL